jgi:hypothetical protein
VSEFERSYIAARKRTCLTEIIKRAGSILEIANDLSAEL